MNEYIELSAARPQKQQLTYIAAVLENGGVIAYPTDSGYALGCKLGLKKPLERIKKLRNLSDSHNFTLICRDLSDIARYARVDNPTYRLLKRLTPGSYTFILNATHQVPKITQTKKKTIGIRIPDHPIALALVAELGVPLVSTTLILPGEKEPLVYPEDVSVSAGPKVELVIDGGYCGFEPTTVVDLSGRLPVVLRVGGGDPSVFGVSE